jgi:hypothetical protein
LEEEKLKTRPKYKLYLTDAQFSKFPNRDPCIYGKVLRDETGTYSVGMHVITCPIIKKCNKHIYESNTMIYIIVDKSL